ncbi:MFS transporter [Desertihabitans aurantiacus]|uniref:MFS transporter n=1 Tax=Desertihabitans aurantiacus TaxID=2282477 RepID=UPI000DF74A66|nr:MFS transporter [Desertihabitans aurantiacus]
MTAPAHPRTARASSAAGAIWRDPFLRAAFASLFLSGIAVSATVPQMTLFLVDELGASEPVAGLYYLTNLLAPLAGYWLGSLSDRQRDRLTSYRVCSLVGGVGWVAMALATQVWMPFAIAAVALSISGASMGLLFAAVRDHLTRHGSTAAHRVVSAVRMAFTTGWILGPVLGSWFGAVVGLRPLLIATAALTVGQLLPLGLQRVVRHTVPAPRTIPDAPGSGEAAPARTSRAPLYVFVLACVLLMNGDTIKFAFLPLYMANQLELSDALRGAVIGIQPLVELALMPLFARLADRIGPLRVITIGAAIGIAANVAYATSTHVAGLFVGQLLMAALWAAVAGLGVTVAQQLYPDGVGLASSVFMSSIMLSGGLGGAIGGLGVALLGIPHIFFVSAVLTALGLVVLLRLARGQSASAS